MVVVEVDTPSMGKLHAMLASVDPEPGKGVRYARMRWQK